MKTNRRSKNRKAAKGGKGDPMDRKEILALLSNLLKEAIARVGTQRIRNPQAFKMRMESIRVISYSLSVYGTILNATEMDDILERLDRLDAQERGTPT